MSLLDEIRSGLTKAKKLGAVSNDTSVGSLLTLDENLEPSWPAPPDGGSGSVPYVTVQSGDPTDFVTPLVSADSGLYAWDGAAYQLVADAPA